MKRFAPIVLIAALIFLIHGSVTAAAGSVPADQTKLVPYTVVNGEIPVSLTGQPGDPIEGQKVVLASKLGNCLACHSMPIKGATDPGNVGPDLRGVGSLSPGLLRLRIVNPKLIDPQTIMPAYYRIAGLNRVSPEFAGKPILTAQQVEDVIAFLGTLK